MNFKTVETLDAPKEMYDRISEEFTEAELRDWMDNCLNMVLVHMRMCAEDIDNIAQEDEAILTVSEPFLFLLGLVNKFDMLGTPKELH